MNDMPVNNGNNNNISNHNNGEYVNGNTGYQPSPYGNFQQPVNPNNQPGEQPQTKLGKAPGVNVYGQGNFPPHQGAGAEPGSFPQPGTGNQGYYTQSEPVYTNTGAGYQSPASIYERSQNNNEPFGGAPQYHYGAPVNMFNNQYYAQQQFRNENRRIQQKEIKKLAAVIALSMAGFLCISAIFSIFISFENVKDLYFSSSAFSSAIGILYSVSCVGIPFLLARKYLKSSGNDIVIPLNKPADAKKSFLLIVIGLAGCMGANYVTAVITTMFENVGIHFKYSEGADPANAFDVVMLFVGTAIVPALIEEFAMRGVILQSLRKYGNAFAIIATAFCFGIFHGNPSQIPFAFICGLFMSYAVLASGSLWTGIIIHFLVNSIACLQAVVNSFVSEEAAQIYWIVVLGVSIAAGIAALVVYLKQNKNTKVLAYKGIGDFTTGEKFKKFLANPGMIIITAIFIFEALTYVTLKSGAY